MRKAGVVDGPFKALGVVGQAKEYVVTQTHVVDDGRLVSVGRLWWERTRKGTDWAGENKHWRHCIDVEMQSGKRLVRDRV